MLRALLVGWSFKPFFLLRIYNIASGKQKSVIKTPTGDDGSLIKVRQTLRNKYSLTNRISFLSAQVTLDPSGLYAATSSSDKTVSLFDFYSGECLAKLYGHSGGWGFLLLNHFRNAHHSSNNFLLSSEVVTQLQFSRDCKYLYSVSGDRFVWLRLSDNSYQSCLLQNTMTSFQNTMTSLILHRCCFVLSCSCIFIWRLSRALTQVCVTGYNNFTLCLWSCHSTR